MSAVPVLLGVDVGTSHTKVLVATRTGDEIVAVATPTLWRHHNGKFTDIDPEDLLRSVLSLLAKAVTAASGQVEAPVVAAIAVTGMAEAGVLITESGQAIHPVIAWFDPRGEAEVRRLPAQLLAEFCGRTGLPVSSLATIAKLAWMREQGTHFRDRQWLNIPEFLVHRLGGARASEFSLTARTGLLDQDSGALWSAALDAIGATPDLIPPLVVAGTPLGRACGQLVPEVLHGAVLTVAGHDHAVAAVGCGATGANDVFDSFGTAEALVRSVDGNLDHAARDRLASAGINAVHHVLSGRRLLLAATKAGLLMRRTLDLLGATGDLAREDLDTAAVELANLRTTQNEEAEAGVQVLGAANDDGTLHITITADGVTPAALWLATVEHSIEEAERCLKLMAAEIGPAGTVIVAGGWTKMNSVRRAKARSQQHIRFSARAQAGAFGATMFAAHAAEVAEQQAQSGNHTGNSVQSPIGPSESFAARYTLAVT